MSPLARDARVCLGCKAPVVAAFLTFVGFLVSTPVLATTVKHLDLGEIIEAADTIVEGRVDSIRSFWQGRQIYTEVSVRVARALKGPRQDGLPFLQAGGGGATPGADQRTVPGAPVYRVGAGAYFFLRPGRPGARLG